MQLDLNFCIVWERYSILFNYASVEFCLDWKNHFKLKLETRMTCQTVRLASVRSKIMNFLNPWAIYLQSIARGSVQTRKVLIRVRVLNAGPEAPPRAYIRAFVCNLVHLWALRVFVWECLCLCCVVLRGFVLCCAESVCECVLLRVFVFVLCCAVMGCVVMCFRVLCHFVLFCIFLWSCAIVLYGWFCIFLFCGVE